MKKLKKAMRKIAQKIIDMVMGNGLMQDETTASGERYVTPGIADLIRRAGAESCVLIKNDGTLPIRGDGEIAVFGRCQLDWFYVGYGSGGDVNAPYYVNLIDGLLSAGAKINAQVLDRYKKWTEEEDNKADHGWWGHWPMNHPEMPIDDELAASAASSSDTAIVIIGRAAGEDRENTLTKGSYYLTDEERRMLDAVCAHFSKVAVLMNIGNIMDLSWTEEYQERISALMIVWQGGMESGNSVADVLMGKVSPSGRLADSIARNYEDYPSSANFGGLDSNRYEEGIYVGYRYFDLYPDKILYPFGFGLSYSEFKYEDVQIKRDFGKTLVSVKVSNTGKYAASEAVLLWAYLPKGRIDKPIRVLAGFAKTDILGPGCSQSLSAEIDDEYIASFDETRSSFILEAGEYIFYANEEKIGSYILDGELELSRCHSLCKSSDELRKRIIDRLPEEMKFSGSKTNDFRDVLSGQSSLEDFVSGLSDDDLEGLSRGHGMMGSLLGVEGNAGVFGGVTESLQNKYVPPIICSDGPAGLRLRKYCALLPCGTALACTFNTKLIEKLYAKVGEEMIHYGVDVILGPGMNIHRNPLCGRNFEYFSEDPLLSGKIAAAFIKGVQSKGRAACPKHYACNNQETKRNTNDSIVSERALREIYLKNFEIAVKEARPLCIMTSYNKVNGVWSHYNYDLLTTVLREEWGFDGCVITDWWMQRSKSPEFPALRNNAYRVRAQVDVLMPGNMGHLGKRRKKDKTLLETLGQEGGITRAELQRTAANVLRLAKILKSNNKTI